MKRLIAGLIAITALTFALGVSAAKPPVASAQQCGPMDVVFLIDDTGSMDGAIGNVQTEAANLIADIDTASGSDFQLGLITFKDNVVVVDTLAAGAGTVEADILALVADYGADEPEASDEALNTAINFGTWRAGAVKIAILITDARPGGFDDTYTVGVDDVNAHQRALDAAAANILISAVYVPTYATYTATIVPIMQDYADTTGGIYTETASTGISTASAIAAIIEECGGEGVGPPVGGIAEPRSGGDAPTDVSGSSSARDYTAAIAGAAALAVAVVAASGWYARRRWLS